jgi:hypothetical protein
MEKPDLNQMWETFVRLSWDDVPLGRHINIIREKIFPLLSDLEKKGIINWYCFLIYDRKSGVPTSNDDNNPYIHIRFSLTREIAPKDFLPSYCVLTRKIPVAGVNTIAGIDKTLLKNEEIVEAWHIIGEQSECIFKMLDIFKEGINIPLNQIGQFLHFFANMTQLRVV